MTEPIDDVTREFVKTYAAKTRLGLLERDDFSWNDFYDWEEWEEAKRFTEAEEKKRQEWSLIERRKHIEDGFAERLIEEFVEKHFPGARFEDRRFLNVGPTTPAVSLNRSRPNLAQI